MNYIPDSIAVCVAVAWSLCLSTVMGYLIRLWSAAGSLASVHSVGLCRALPWLSLERQVDMLRDIKPSG